MALGRYLSQKQALLNEGDSMNDCLPRMGYPNEIAITRGEWHVNAFLRFGDELNFNRGPLIGDHHMFIGPLVCHLEYGHSPVDPGSIWVMNDSGILSEIPRGMIHLKNRAANPVLDGRHVFSIGRGLWLTADLWTSGHLYLDDGPDGHLYRQVKPWNDGKINGWALHHLPVFPSSFLQAYFFHWQEPSVFPLIYGEEMSSFISSLRASAAVERIRIMTL